MSEEEYENMKNSGVFQEGGGGASRVANPASPDSYKDAKSPSLYVEYDVPANSLKPAGSGWSRIPAPNSPEGRLAATKGVEPPSLPPVRNIQVVTKK